MVLAYRPPIGQSFLRRHPLDSTGIERRTGPYGGTEAAQNGRSEGDEDEKPEHPERGTRGTKPTARTPLRLVFF